MSELPPEQYLTCENCGHDRAEHHAANLADGAFVGAFFLVCPTATFKARDYDPFGRPFVTRAATEPR